MYIAGTNGDDADDKAKIPVVQQKGRFKVTSENVDLEKVSLDLMLSPFSPSLNFNRHMRVYTHTHTSVSHFGLLFQVAPSPTLQKSYSMQVL